MWGLHKTGMEGVVGPNDLATEASRRCLCNQGNKQEIWAQEHLHSLRCEQRDAEVGMVWLCWASAMPSRYQPCMQCLNVQTLIATSMTQTEASHTATACMHLGIMIDSLWCDTMPQPGLSNLSRAKHSTERS